MDLSVIENGAENGDLACSRCSDTALHYLNAWNMLMVTLKLSKVCTLEKFLI